jgi:hypothetical protein
MTVINLDDEGFVNKVDDQYFWAAFGDVEAIELADDPVKSQSAF